ncbi:hypothetical protein, conserved [Eimeria acervulina]|uniref:Retrotransposon gag domain-containing protein n=1 Tax=Eimeria acervulina TaxID=5801 RepID=U6GR22_EIMAC|nr:hypothetical protein, conserved [Eimeria acervulina]CDI82635.1 hypothetical protein, conserved [Eimeria acervulina]
MSTVQESSRFNRASAPQPTAVANPAPRELPQMAAPKKPVVDMQPQERHTDEGARLRQEVKRLQNYLIERAVVFIRTTPPLAREKGNNMQPFLMLIEQRFRKMALPRELWGDELGEYLDEDALQCWMDLKLSGTDMADWALIKQELIRCFSTVDQAALIYQMAANKWKGDHSTYTANFSRIVARGSQLSAEDLVGYFLTNIPAELRWAVTQRGTKQFSDWRDAAHALAAVAAPWAAAQEEFRRREREFQLCLTGRAAELPRATVSTEIRRYTRASGDRTEMVCYQCKGKARGTWLRIVQPVIRQRANPEQRVGTVEVWATTLVSAEQLFVRGQEGAATLHRHPHSSKSSDLNV